MKVDVAVRQLEQALERLSWDAERQIDYTRRLGVGVDELALEFDDSYRPVSRLIEEGLLPEALSEAIKFIDQSLEGMTRTPEDKWTEDAVRASQEWLDMRKTARQAVSLLQGIEFDTDDD
ncbi:hypothetical protein [Streptomyces yerevanensis]|uniref:hypothetical protein n=1 Tax=Streptomyces yerevanensis TaxID=66378 RepID=UPI00052798DE|nr:hypothetical protein [Streptomyces yerevanensis]